MTADLDWSAFSALIERRYSTLHHYDRAKQRQKKNLTRRSRK